MAVIGEKRENILDIRLNDAKSVSMLVGPSMDGASKQQSVAKD
jgi:hypothetical protein